MYHVVMNLSARDRTILLLLADFGLLTLRQLHGLAFGTQSLTPTQRAINRLRETRLITRLDFRLVSPQGGAGEYVYKLAPNGLRFARPSDRYRYKVGNFLHTLAIAETFLQIRQGERQRSLDIISYATEPDCWATVGGVELHPDLRVDYEVFGRRYLTWFEVDLSTEKERQLKGKCEAFYEAWTNADVNEWPAFPRVWWVTLDEGRANVLRRVIGQLPAEAGELFEVSTMDDLHKLWIIDID